MPIVQSYFGGDVCLTSEDIKTIEDLIAIGAGLDMVATQLDLDLADFKRIGKVSTHIQAAVKRGRAKDKWEYDQALRSASLGMKSPILSIWHGKQQFGMTDKTTTKHEGSTVVVVNTGVPSPITINKSSDKPVIEHE